jgi:ubiquinone/menaquinone biosynthesis C-methylase UbiE
VWGIDPSAEMLARARAKPLPGGGFKQASAERLPFKDGWFEAAVLRQVVHLVDRPRAFAELARVLRPGGRAVVATFAPEHFGGFWLVRYFAAVERIDRARFPEPTLLAVQLEAAGFDAPRARRLVQRGRMSHAEALERLRGRYISTLHLLADREYEDGLARAERELPAEVDYELHWVVLTADRGLP